MSSGQTSLLPECPQGDRQAVCWLQNFRRVVVRYARPPENFLGMCQLAWFPKVCRRIEDPIVAEHAKWHAGNWVRASEWEFCSSDSGDSHVGCVAQSILVYLGVGFRHPGPGEIFLHIPAYVCRLK